MIIKDVRTTRIALPWVEVPKMAASYNRPRELLIVEIETKSGVVGMGFLHSLHGGLQAIDALLHDQFKPLLLGRDATHVEALWKAMWQAGYGIGRMGVAMFALSAVDIALWDAIGKHANLPLYRLWGGFREEIPVYGSGCYRGLGGDGMIEKARRYVSQGFKAIKMQAAHLHDLRTDADNVRRMREALGPGIDIMIDINQGWTADVAILMGRKFEQHDIYWMEEPVPAHDFEGYMRVAQSLDLRVVGGENHYTRFDLKPFFLQPRIPILQPDVMRNGLTELRKIAAVADTFGIQMAPHLFPELMVHLMASIPNGLWLEYMGWLDDLWVDPLVIQNGMMRPPQRPGHGLRFKPEVLRDHRVKD